MRKIERLEVIYRCEFCKFERNNKKTVQEHEKFCSCNPKNYRKIRPVLMVQVESDGKKCSDNCPFWDCEECRLFLDEDGESTPLEGENGDVRLKQCIDWEAK